MQDWLYNRYSIGLHDRTVARVWPDRMVLFRGRGAFFKRLLLESRNYLEYGMGRSTIFAANAMDNVLCSIHSVETDSQVFHSINQALKWRRQEVANQSTQTLVDVGPISEWGRPKSYAMSGNFRKYIEQPSIDHSNADFVLVDGRWRVATFLFSLINLQPGTRILFDDYLSRHHYHVVEEFVSPSETYRNQALFVIPDSLPYDQIRDVADQFVRVFD